MDAGNVINMIQIYTWRIFGIHLKSYHIVQCTGNILYTTYQPDIRSYN
jgi:hypothetical protein